MPFSPGGVFSLVASYFANPGDTITVEQHNPVFEDVASGLSLALVRDGRSAMTGPLKVVDGTSSAPGIAFASDPTKGFFKDDSGNIVPTAPLAGGVPIGAMMMWPLAGNAPAGWIFDGATYNRADYPALAALAVADAANPSSWFTVGDGSTTFGIKSAKGRALVGVDADGAILGSIVGLGGTIGTKGTTLTQAQLPAIKPDITVSETAHVHTQDQMVDSGQTCQAGPNGTIWQKGSNNTGPAKTNLTAAFTANLGSGQEHSNLQPSMGVRYIFRAF